VTSLAELAATSRRVAGTSSKTAKVEALAELLRRLAREELEIGIGYLSGETRQGKSGIGGSILERVAGAAPALAASMSLTEVDRQLQAIADVSGKGSVAARVERLGALFRALTGEEQAFLTALLLGGLRQGALAGLMADAVAVAAKVDARSVRRAAMLAGGLIPAARAALTEGTLGLSRITSRLLEPVLPMLAQPAEDVAEALALLGAASFEWKLDGARVQVHRSGDEVRVFSRRLNEVTAAVPEVVEAVRALPARELILDGEVIALRADRRPHPFQVTMRRFGRVLGVEEARRELPLSVMFFDCLRSGGDDLLDRPLADRAAALAALCPPELIVPRQVIGSLEEAERFVREALERGHEGAMAKALSSPYEAGRRGASWLKLKRAHTLDLVVLAAEWGHGRRTGWLSNLHLGARDAEQGGFVMLGKTFKGLTDQILGWQTEELLRREIGRDRYTVFVRPELVVEIAYNDLQASREYPGGLALRFARVKRYRADKTATDADTIEVVRRAYAAQERPDRPE
jgi:DNA ligase-1